MNLINNFNLQKVFEKYFLETLQGILSLVLYAIFWCFSPTFSSWLGGKSALLLAPLFPQNSRAIRNLKQIYPNLDNKNQKKILYEAIENLGRNAGEYPHLGKLQEFISVSGLENIKNNQPIIFVAAHLANWELTPFPGILINRPVMRVYRKLNAPISEWLLRKRSSPLPGEVVPKGREGALRMLSTLRSGGIVLLLSDQRLNTGIQIDFMGKPANTLTTPAVMAKKFNCPIIPLQIIRKKGCSFEIIIHPKIKMPPKNMDDDLSTKKIMNDINSIISQWVHQNPGQWFWHHRRWKV